MRGEINTIYPELCVDDMGIRGIDGRYHYFYKIVNNVNDNFYYGIHSTYDLDDNYKGSGTRLKSAYKKYGLKNFTKYILHFFDTRNELLKYEREIVTPCLCNESNCYNIVVGGSGREVFLISVRDIAGNTVNITRDEFQKNRDKYTHHSKGRIVLNNGIRHKYVLPNELDKFLSNGWVKGEISHTTTNRISVKRDGKQKYVLPNELDKFLSNGWVKGGIGRNAGVKSQIKGFVWLTNGNTQKRVCEQDIEEYISKGWVKGTCQKSTKGYIKLTNGTENVSIDPTHTEEINYYLSNGWSYGLSRVIRKHVWVNNGINSKMILLTDVDKYAQNGWILGRLKKDMPPKIPNIVIVSKDGIAKQILKTELDAYLSDGWKRGNCNIHPATNTGKIVIHKDNKNKFIYPSELDEYLSNGWTKGKCKKML